MKNVLDRYFKGMLCLIALLLLSLVTVAGGSTGRTLAAGATLSGPGTVRAGDYITLYLTTSETGKYGFEGDISASGVSISSVSIGQSGWKLENNGSHYLGYDDNLSNPTQNGSTLLIISGTVGAGATGSAISVSVSNLTISDASAGTSVGTVTYSQTLAAPLSGNTNLSSLSVDGLTLSPAFSAANKTYSVGEVEFSTSTLSVAATAEDSKSRVSITGNTLAVGANTVYVTVTAESGASASYTISVTRKQDPNYVASNDTTLSGISVSSGMLSPSFDPTVKDYVVYLPYEMAGTSFDATGTAADAKATGVTAGNIAALAAGVNTTSVVCKAEDGTEGSYNITVYVMPSFNGAVPQIGDTPAYVPSSDDGKDEKNEKEDDTDKKDSLENTKTEKASGVKVLYVILIAVATAIIVGGGTFGLCYYFMILAKKETKSEL